MNFEELGDALGAALRRARLELIPGDDVQLDLRTLARIRRFHVYVERRVPDPFVPHLGAGARVELRWDAMDTARLATTEEDVVREILGPAAGMRRTRTAPHVARIALELSANVVNGSSLPDPGAFAWRRWRTDLEAGLAGPDALVDVFANDIDDDGNLEIVAWQGEPTVTLVCATDGSMRASGLGLEAWQSVSIPRRWDDPRRRPDRGPDLTSLVARLSQGIDRWVAALGHVDPPQEPARA